MKSSVFKRKLQINQKVVHLKFSQQAKTKIAMQLEKLTRGIHWILLAVLFSHGDLSSVLGKEALRCVTNHKQSITTSMIGFSGVDLLPMKGIRLILCTADYSPFMHNKGIVYGCI